MRYIKEAFADDLIFATTGQKVDATNTDVVLQFGKRVFKFDCTDETMQHIDNLLDPIFKALESLESKHQRQQIASPPQASIEAPGLRVTREMRRTDKKKYMVACRAWARAIGRGDEITHGSYCPSGLCDSFDKYLSRHGG